MTRSTVLSALLLAACAHPVPPRPTIAAEGWPAADVVARVVLLGDGGQLCPPWLGGKERDCSGTSNPLFGAARAAVAAAPTARVIWLGDNVYEAGARGPEDDRAKAILAEQVSAAPDPGMVAFVPGNHDWAQSFGITAPRARWERDLVTALGAVPRAYPGEGLADGLVEEEVLADRLQLVYADSERAIKRRGLREPTAATIGKDLEKGLPTLLVMHHPLATGGGHGTSNRGCIAEDLNCRAYADWNTRLRGVLAGSGTPVVVASGHDHDMQVLDAGVPGRAVRQVVSGAAAEPRAIPRTLGSAEEPDDGPGFAILDVLASGFRLTIVRLATEDAGGCTPVGGVYACATDLGNPLAASVATGPVSAG